MTANGGEAVPTLARRSGYVAVALMITQLIAHLLLLTKGTDYLTSILTHDDTYYYLETAWNHSKIGHPTFDGINSTNCVHILWYALTLAVSYFLPSKYLLLPVSLGLCALFGALPYLFIIGIGRRLNSALFTIAMSLFWFATSMGPNNNINGMENSLHGLVLCWALYEIVRFLDAARLNERPNLLRLALSLTANALSRFDSGILSVVVFAICVMVLAKSCGGLSDFARSYRNAASMSVAVPGAAAGLQFLLYWRWAGTAMPISGIVKMSGLFPYPGHSFAGKGYELLKLSLASFTQFVPPHVCAPLVVLVSIGVTALALSTILGRTDVLDKSLAGAILVWFSGCAAYMTVLWLSPVRQFNYWYFSAAKIYWVLCLATALYISIKHLSRIKRERLGNALVLSAFLVSLSLGLYRYVTVAWVDPNPNGMYYTRYQAALWLRDNIQKEYVMASWNAGQLGFFSGHSVINLDGLANGKEYLSEVLLGDHSLSSYLRAKNVRFIVDYQDYTVDGITGHLTVLRSFPVTVGGTGEPLRVWDLASLPEGAEMGYYGRRR